MSNGALRNHNYVKIPLPSVSPAKKPQEVLKTGWLLSWLLVLAPLCFPLL